MEFQHYEVDALAT